MNKLFIILLIIFFFLRQIMFLNADSNTYINTTNVTYDEKKNIVELAEGSKININNVNILVDKGIIDYEKNSIEVFGNFYLYQELNILSGKDLIGNTNMDYFEAIEVSYIYNNDLKIDSDEVHRSDGTLYFYNNFLTPCELEGYFNCPTWSLRIDETRYDINKDKYDHFDTFIQIADYKVFYLPYFSHYGAKAPRNRGFLTPSIEFNLVGDLGFTAPYYIPINVSSDVILKPKFFLDDNFNYLDKFTLNTLVNLKNSGGDIYLDVYNEKLENDTDIYSSIKLKAKQVLNKKNILSYEALVTNSISTTRSTNNEPITFEDIFIRLDRYESFDKSDYLRTELSTVEAFDSTNTSLIPLTPSIKYTNQNLLKNNLVINNEISLSDIKRNESSDEKPSDNTFLRVNNLISSTNNYNSALVYNKLSLSSSLGKYSFKHNSDLDEEIFNVSAVLSSDIFYKYNDNINPRIKFVQNLNLISDDLVNEDSEAISFNYHNQFSDSRLYGYDLEDNTGRIIYGSENNFTTHGKKIDFNINQSYDFITGSNYTSRINQFSNFSDLALEAKTSTNNTLFEIDARLDKEKLEKKEMNFLLSYSNNYVFNLNYNETGSSAFKGLSSDTKSMSFDISKPINDNFNITVGSTVDITDKYSPYRQFIKINLFDECSNLEISYIDQRFNDNFNTQPSQTIGLTYSMEYLGFFGYQQNTNLFFEEPGNFNSGNF